MPAPPNSTTPCAPSATRSLGDIDPKIECLLFNPSESKRFVHQRRTYRRVLDYLESVLEQRAECFRGKCDAESLEFQHEFQEGGLEIRFETKRRHVCQRRLGVEDGMDVEATIAVAVVCREGDIVADCEVVCQQRAGFVVKVEQQIADVQRQILIQGQGIDDVEIDYVKGGFSRERKQSNLCC